MTGAKPFDVRPSNDYDFVGARRYTKQYTDFKYTSDATFEYDFQIGGVEITVSKDGVQIGALENLSNPMLYRAICMAVDMARVLAMLDLFSLYDGDFDTTYTPWDTMIWDVKTQKYFVLTDDILEIVGLYDAEKNSQLQIKRQPRSRAGFVYILKSETGQYKIGKTINPDDRLRTFGVKLPFRVEYELVIPSEDHHMLEHELHTRFDYCRIDGEWFDLTDGDLDDLRREFNIQHGSKQ